MVVEEITWSHGARMLVLAAAACLFVPVIWVLLAIPSSRPAAIPLLLLLLLVDLIVVGVFAASYRLRVMLDRDTLTVGFGPFRQRLSVAQITACDPVTYGWLEFGGYGIRYKFWQRTTMYNVPGDHGKAVQLTLGDGRRVLFSAHDPSAVCARLRPHCPQCRQG
jgi:hypothetical protein